MVGKSKQELQLVNTTAISWSPLGGPLAPGNGERTGRGPGGRTGPTSSIVCVSVCVRACLRAYVRVWRGDCQEGGGQSGGVGANSVVMMKTHACVCACACMCLCVIQMCMLSRCACVCVCVCVCV